MKNWAIIARFGNMNDFLFAQSVLELHEITFVLKNNLTYGLDPLTTEMSDKALIVVHRNFFEEVKRILVKYEFGKYLVEE